MDPDATLDATGGATPDATGGLEDRSSPRAVSVAGHRVLGRLGRGGMGAVFRAEAPDGSVVALKRLHGELGPEDEARFLREARLRLDHPNVVRTLRAGIDEEGGAYLVMELLEGRSLAEELRDEGPRSVERVVEIARAVCAALEAVHAEGLVHRDVKPSNVFCCDDGRIKLLDFGVAAHRDASVKLTRTGAIVGTPGHLAPEQAHGEAEVDARADVWAVGVLIFEALTGRLPFVRAGAFSTMLAIATKRAPSLREVHPEAPPSLVRIVDRCLEPKPDDRFADVAALARALERVDPLDRAKGSRATRAVVRGLGALLLATLTGGVVWAYARNATPVAVEAPPVEASPPVEPTEAPSAPAPSAEAPAVAIASDPVPTPTPSPEPTAASPRRAQPAADAPARRAILAPRRWEAPAPAPSDRDPRRPVREFSAEP